VFAHYNRQGQDIKFAHNSPGSQYLFSYHRHRENSGDALYVMGLDNITKQIELLLVTKCVRDVEILIGQNFTELADIEYYKCGDKLLSEHRDALSPTKERLSPPKL
jgi:hypothetical protein